MEDGSELAKQMPCLTKLKHAVYSSEYRAFVEKITGLDEGTLTDEVRNELCSYNNCNELLLTFPMFVVRRSTALPTATPKDVIYFVMMM